MGVASRRCIQITKTPFNESLPRISPDSRWIAYVSDKTGAPEVYIHSFPEPGVEQQVSTGAGNLGSQNQQARPRWSHDGKELFYWVGPVTSQPRFMSVAIKPQGTALNAAAPVEIFRHPVNRGQAQRSIFSVAADGRFLLQLVPGANTTATGPGTQRAVDPAANAGSNHITLILNFPAAKK